MEQISPKAAKAAATPVPAEGAKVPKRRIASPSFIVAHVLWLALLVAIAVPGKMHPPTAVPFYGATVVVEALYLWRYLANELRPSTSYVVCVVWALLIIWELASTDLKIAHPVLVPCPENIFNVFVNIWPELLRNVWASLSLLAVGYFVAIGLGNVLGLFIGWLPKVRETIYPIARVLTPIPAMVFAPYLVATMPSFRVAACAAIFLGIFWPTLLNAILSVGSMDKRIVESARMMGLSTWEIIFKVLLPYTYPAIVGGMKVQMATAMLLLVMAEQYGATAGMGYFVFIYANYGNYTNVIAGIICVGVVVTILDSLVSLLIKKTVKWSK